MPPHLNLPFLIGNDICHVLRVKRILQGRLGPRFVRRILTTEEIRHAAKILRCILDRKTPDARSRLGALPAAESDPASETGTVGFTKAVEFMAGRFAAKEAAIKAHYPRRLTFQSIDIVRMRSSTLPDAMNRTPVDHEEAQTIRPEDGTTLEARGGALIAVVKADGTYPESQASVSISHEEEYATAVCLAMNQSLSVNGSQVPRAT
ncbi:hypothetical protein GGR50DRAFT_259077 [Xylaria sp. CBS 124048]|nr:hypothetical protein GGR50DRAFT_259077 [Xylaria sp. CBS 124048]